MIYCEHFIFSSTKSDKKDGYQIISKSNNVDSNLLSQLENYLSPVGTDPTKFTQLKSLLIIKDKIIFIQTKNIEIGHDGRTNIIYTHGIIVDVMDFKKLHYDSKVLEKLYVESFDVKHLLPLKLEPHKYQPNFTCLDILEIDKFEYFFKKILSGKKIVIFDIFDLDLIQNLLTLLPPSYRLIPFSTLVTIPNKQSKFHLIQAHDDKVLFEKYTSINLTKINIKNNVCDKLFDQCFSHLIQIINSRNTSELTKIYEHYESLLIKDYKTKLTLSILMCIADSKKSYLINNISYELMMILDKMPTSFISKNLKYFTKFLSPQIIDEYEKNSQINNLIIKYKNQTLMFNVIIDMLSRLDTDEKREILFHRLVELRPDDLQSYGSQIIVDSINKKFDSQIINYFLKYDKMHSCITNAFYRLQIDQLKKKKLFYLVMVNSLNNDGIFLNKLFSIDMFNLSSQTSLTDYYDIIEKLFTTNNFYEKLSPKYILIIIKKIYDKLFNSLISNNHSYIIHNIFQGILNIIIYLLSIRNHNLNECKHDLIELKEKIVLIIDKNSLENNLNYKIDVFHPIPSSLIQFIFPPNIKSTNNMGYH